MRSQRSTSGNRSGFASWGDKGYFYMPLEYILDPQRASDFWTVTKVS